MSHSIADAPEASLLERLQKALLSAPRHAQLEFCVAAACFREFSLHDEWAFARVADYVTERLGISAGTWYDSVAVGCLFLSSPQAQSTFRRGEISLTALTLLARHCNVSEAEALLSTASNVSTAELRRLLSTRTASKPGNVPPTCRSSVTPESERPSLVQLHLRLPRSVASYCEDTVELARAIVGHDLPLPSALALVLAESSTEIERSYSRPPRVPEALVARTRTRPSNSTPDRRGRPRLRRPVDRRKLAVELDGILRREHSRLSQLRARGEDLLLEALQSDLHGRLGHPTLTDLAQERLHLSRSTLFEMLRRARLRRAGDPIARALAVGDLSPVHANLLAGLPRLGVPRSCLLQWIYRARNTTVRMLRRLLAWARRTVRTDVLAWARQSYRPPTEQEVRTTESPIEDLARNPDPRLRVHVATEPTETVHWPLETEDHCLLVELVDSLEFELRARGARRPPLWHSLLRLFHLARHAWSQLEAAMPRHPHRRVLERDRYTCQVPGCRHRAVEVHHIQYSSRGGSDEPRNLLCLCAYHHRQGEHAGRMRVRGQVTIGRERLIFELGTHANQPPLLRYRGETLLSASGQGAQTPALSPT